MEFNEEYLVRNQSWDDEYWIGILRKVKTLSDESYKKFLLRKLRRLVFENNLIIVNNGFYIHSDNYKVFLPTYNSYGKIYKNAIVLNEEEIQTQKFSTIFEVINNDCINVSKSLLDEGLSPAVLNMACEDGPGGGVIGGCYGQEEGLFRRTNLYKYMYPFSPHARRYGLELKHPQYPLNSVFDGVYVKNAIVFRDEENKGYKLLEEPFPMSFIAVPALRNPVLQNEELTLEDERKTYEKIKTILKIGLINGHDSLVLGAWGCGIFHNPPIQIARLFKKAFDDPIFFNRFKRISFAILEDDISKHRKNGIGNLQPFKTIFDKIIQ